MLRVQGTLTGPQWALGGDTWVVGVPIPDDVVLPEFNKLNPDAGKYEGPCGMYKPGCGLKNLKFAYGHDEYMYQVRCSATPLTTALSSPRVVATVAMVRYCGCCGTMMPNCPKRRLQLFGTTRATHGTEREITASLKGLAMRN